MRVAPSEPGGTDPGDGTASMAPKPDQGACMIVIHPSGRLDDAGAESGFWAEVPALPDCGGLAAATPDEVFARTVSEVRQWSRSRAGHGWLPVHPEVVFVAVHAW